jgi:pyrroline-5-carboxylate reductase
VIVGILGFGTLGRAIAAGLHVHDGVESVIATTRRGFAPGDDARVEAPADNLELARGADVILVCVKPFQVEGVLTPIASALRPEQLVISCAASVSTAKVRQWTGDRVPVIRAMPNMPCRIREGMTVLAAGSGATAVHVALAESLFATLGLTATIDERLMDAATGISGSGPAYAYVIIEALSDAGVKVGLSRAIAQRLAAQTVLGSAKLLLETGRHPGELKDMVTSPGGTAIAGLHTLEAGGLRTTLIDAVEAATLRAHRLGKRGSGD